MPKQTKKGTNMKVTGTFTTKNKTRRRKAGKEASATDYCENHKEVMLSVISATGYEWH